MAFVTSLLNALAAIPKIVGYVEQFAAAVTDWYVKRQTAQTLSMIADAAALGARAKTQKDRLDADKAWKAALSRDRYIS
jgi:PIN domain nuclease of toxin-antitoxin system